MPSVFDDAGSVGSISSHNSKSSTAVGTGSGFTTCSYSTSQVTLFVVTSRI